MPAPSEESFADRRGHERLMQAAIAPFSPGNLPATSPPMIPRIVLHFRRFPRTLAELPTPP